MSIYPMGTYKQSPLLSTKSELGETVKPDVETLRNAKEAQPCSPIGRIAERHEVSFPLRASDQPTMSKSGLYAFANGEPITWAEINLKHWRPRNG